MKEVCTLNLNSETTQHFCNTCSVVLKSKDAHKIQEGHHDVDCHLTE